MRADIELELERPIRDRRDFVSVALPASWINGTGFVVGYLLEEIDGHRLPEHEDHEDWTVTVRGAVSDWLDLARAADTDQLAYPLENCSPMKLLRTVAEEGVGSPNALLALVQWAEQRGADTTRDTWLTEYRQRVSDDE